LPKADDPVTRYAKDVMAKRIVAGRPVRLACKRHLADLKTGKARGLMWRPERALHAIKFFERFLRLEDGRPFVLLPYLAFIVGSIFGWYEGEHRRYHTAYVEMGKGNAKTPVAAGIGLYGMVADKEAAPEIYSAATMQDQAAIAYRDAKRMVEAHPDLKALIKSEVGALSIEKRHAVFRAVSSEHKGLDGKRPHISLIDELQEHPTSLVVDKLSAGMKARRNGLTFEITNSGWDRTSVCWAHHQYSLQVLDGSAKDEAWFAYICSLDPCAACRKSGKTFPSCEKCDDWRDLKKLRKANPGMGTVLPESYIVKQIREAVGMPSKENIVKRLNACIWTEAEERWLAMETWDACPGMPLKLEDYAGQPCMAGLDAASTQDISALVLMFGPDDEGLYDVLTRFWIPRATIDAKDSGRTEQDRQRLHQWVDQGWITATSGEVTDYDQMEADIKAMLATVDLKRLSFDRWGVTQLVTHLIDAFGEQRVVPFSQTMANMTAPTKELEKIITGGKLRHGSNPVLRWMASNVALIYGPNEQVKPDRKRSGEKIDGIIALIEALDGAMRQPKATSIYDERAARGEEVLKFV